MPDLIRHLHNRNQRNALYIYVLRTTIMKIFFLILSISVVNSVQGQIESYKIAKNDTITIPDISFRRVAAFHFANVTILAGYDLFMKYLTTERKGLKKQIRVRERMIKRGNNYPGITLSQLKSYQSQFVSVDSVFIVAKRNKTDTFHVDYYKTSIGSFIPSAIENGQCVVLDSNNHKQKCIIKLSGSKKTGQMTAIGSSFYFIPGTTKYFLSKMDWVS